MRRGGGSISRWLTGEAAGADLDDAESAVAGKPIRVVVGGLLLGTGLALGAGLFLLIDIPEGGAEAPAAHNLTTQSDGHGGSGCTTLALNRDRGHTLAEPCPARAPQVATAPLFLAGY